MFSVIKKFRTPGPEFLLPDRNAVTMTVPFMRAYTELLVRTCHKRGAHAIGGMAAFIPCRRDPEVNEVALAKVRADKTREAGDGFDGSWVAHPDLVPICREVFDGVLGDRPNQLDRLREDVSVTAADLLDVADDARAASPRPGLRNNVDVGIQYLAAWLGGNGAVGDPQPDGGRGDRRDLPFPGVAVGAQRRQLGDTGAAVTASSWSGSSRRSSRRSLGEPGFDEALTRRPPRCSRRSPLDDDFVDSLRCPRTTRMP